MDNETSQMQVYDWQLTTWQQLRDHIRRNRLAHAYLLTGLPDTGRYQFAQALSAYVLCQADKAGRETACGQCSQCRLFASAGHPDVLEILPEEGSRNIKIDQVRQIADHVQQTSNQTDATKIVIIQPAGALGTAAANSLLKNLEEPPGKALFLLIADPHERLLPTIRSRCQLLPLAAPDRQQTLAWLTAMSAAPPDLLTAAAALAPNQPFRALQMLEEGVPAWRDILSARLLDLQRGQDSVSELARFCEKQPISYATTLMAELCMARVRQLAAVPALRNSARVRQLLHLQRDIHRVEAEQGSPSNPNLLLSLEYLLSRWQDASAAMESTAQS